MRRKRLRKVILVVLGLVAVYLGVCFKLALNYIHPPRYVSEKPAYVDEVMVPTEFGPTPSWATPALADGNPSKVVFVLAHGYGGGRGTWTDPVKDLTSRGFDCLVPAMPGQDASPAKSVGFGLSEAKVIVDSVHWVRSHTKHPVKVIVLGVSMGGGAAWIASAEEPSIDGIITESAYGRFDEAMNRFFDRRILGGSIIFAPVVSFAKMLTGIKPEAVRPEDEAELWKGKPAMIIQAGDDNLITIDQAQRLSKAASCPLWIVPGAGHARCYETAREEYLSKVSNFAYSLEGVGKPISPEKR